MVVNTDLEYRPEDYFSESFDARTYYGSRIKGELRRQTVLEALGQEKVPEALLKSSLKREIREVLVSQHPWNMGGEYLPDLSENEVEICRVVLKSTTLDVYSIRARRISELISYRVVDEYDTEFSIPHAKNQNTLTMCELIENIDECQMLDGRVPR